jgi:hypothetical protein
MLAGTRSGRVWWTQTQQENCQDFVRNHSFSILIFVASNCRHLFHNYQLRILSFSWSLNHFGFLRLVRCFKSDIVGSLDSSSWLQISLRANTMLANSLDRPCREPFLTQRTGRGGDRIISIFLDQNLIREFS